MKLIYTAIFVLAMFPAIAQTGSGSIQGMLKDQQGEPAPFVAVILLNKDSAIVKTDMAKDNGTFTFLQVKPGQYRVATSSVQFKGYLSPFFTYTGTTMYDVGELTLSPAVLELKEVQVSATRPIVEIHPDKTVFNVQSTINAAGNDGLDLLSKAPGILIDNNENLIVMGKSGVLIYIDGKRIQLSGDDLVAMLRGLRSENIESIEIITNPSSKYDAEGNAGIINIRLKREANLGLNGNVVVGYSRDIQDRYNTGITLNNRSKKTNIFGSYTHYNNTGENHLHLDKRLNGFRLDNISRVLWQNIGHEVRGGADYFINTHHTVGILVNASFNDRSNEIWARTPITELESNTLTQVLRARNTQLFETSNKNINLNYQYTGKKGSTLNIDADYGRYDNDDNNYQPNVYYDAQEETELSHNANRNERDTEINIKTLKADYETPLGKGKLGAGFKFSNVASNNKQFFFIEDGNDFVYDPSRSNIFNYTEKVTAFYMNYNRKLSEQIAINAGLRSETTASLGELVTKTNTELDKVKRSYTNLFPQAGMTYEVNKNNVLGISYSKRINRPNYQNLNPFEFKLDELTFEKGNPFLKPQYTDNCQLTYSWKNTLNVILGYSATQNIFARVIEPAGERGSFIVTRNLADSKNVAATISYPINITKWWNILGNVNVYYATYDAHFNGGNINLDVLAYNTSFQSTFLLPKDFKIECSAWYNSPSIWQGTIKAYSMWSSTVGVRKTIFKRYQLSASVNDIFNSQKWHMRSNFAGVEVDGRGRGTFRRFIVGVNYRFGNQKVKAARNRKVGIEEEKSRLSEN